LGVGRGFWTIVVAHVSFTTSVVSVVVRARLAGFDRSLEEAAQDLGASPLRVFADVTLPLIAPAVVAGWLLAFTLSVDQLVISSFVSGPQSTTLPMIVYSKVRLGLTPDVNALATLIVAAVGLVTALAATASRRGQPPG
ncbi:MAG: ABC transporter permease, partial [Janthinobacterium lividum]